MLQIRPARANDRETCIALIETLAQQSADPGWRETFDALLERTRGEIHVAEADGRILGVATVSYNLAIRYSGEYAQLEELIVDPAARGQNAGGALVEAAVAAARARGCAEFGLYLFARTEGNRAFYEKYGFVLVGSEMRQVL